MLMKTPFTPLIKSLSTSIPFVAPETIERNLGHAFTTRIGANESSFGISPIAKEYIDKAIQSISHYSDPEWGLLREVIADKHQIEKNKISVGAGIDDLLGLIVRIFLGEGKTPVASLGSYGVFHYHLAGYGVRCLTTPYLENGFNDLDTLATLAQEEDATVVYLSNPDNPAGTCFPKEDILAFIDKIPENCIVIIDEAYIEFASEGTALPSNELSANVIQMRTFSKAHGLAGCRIGYAIASPEVVEGFDKVRLHFNVNGIAQAAALGSLQDNPFIQEVVDQVAEGKTEYEALADSLGVATLRSSTNFVNFDAGNPERANAIVEQLAHQGIFIRKPMAAPLDRYFRVTVGSVEERQRFAEALPKVLAKVISPSYSI